MKKLFIITGANGHLGGTIVRMLNGRPVQVRGLVFGDKKSRIQEVFIITAGMSESLKL
ncbi:MAG: hypothetical protein ACLVJ4_12545 [Mediterraneibacter sp.]